MWLMYGGILDIVVRCFDRVHISGSQDDTVQEAKKMKSVFGRFYEQRNAGLSKTLPMMEIFLFQEITLSAKLKYFKNEIW